MKCRYNYTTDCGEIRVVADLTVYPSDHTIRERSQRKLCQSCFDHLEAVDGTIIHSFTWLVDDKAHSDWERKQVGREYNELTKCRKGKP